MVIACVIIVHSLSSGKVAATPILKSVNLLFSKLQSRGTLTRQFSPKVAHKDRDKEKITAITVSEWLIINGGESGSEEIKMWDENYIRYEVSVQLAAFVCTKYYFHRLLTSS